MASNAGDDHQDTNERPEMAHKNTATSNIGGQSRDSNAMKADATTTTTKNLLGPASVGGSLTRDDPTSPACFTLAPDLEMKNKWVNGRFVVTDFGPSWRHPETGKIIDAAELKARFEKALAETQERFRQNPHLVQKPSRGVSPAVFHEWLQKQMEENERKWEQSEGNPHRKCSQ